MENAILAVDLGLPFKVLWADRNLGADCPEAYGDYFAWGDVEAQRDYSKAAYRYYRNREYVDIGENISATDYDAAAVRLGGGWRLPTLKEVKNLLSSTYCVWEPATEKSVKGYKVTGVRTGNSIFLPCAGIMMEKTLKYAGNSGNYWSSEVSPYGQEGACGIAFERTETQRHLWDYKSRHFGACIRAVCKLPDHK